MNATINIFLIAPKTSLSEAVMFFSMCNMAQRLGHHHHSSRGELWQTFGFILIF